jgi:hypothetical protein
MPTSAARPPSATCVDAVHGGQEIGAGVGDAPRSTGNLRSGVPQSTHAAVLLTTRLRKLGGRGTERAGSLLDPGHQGMQADGHRMDGRQKASGLIGHRRLGDAGREIAIGHPRGDAGRQRHPRGQGRGHALRQPGQHAHQRQHQTAQQHQVALALVHRPFGFLLELPVAGIGELDHLVDRPAVVFVAQLEHTQGGLGARAIAFADGRNQFLLSRLEVLDRWSVSRRIHGGGEGAGGEGSFPVFVAPLELQAQRVPSLDEQCLLRGHGLVHQLQAQQMRFDDVRRRRQDVGHQVLPFDDGPIQRAVYSDCFYGAPGDIGKGKERKRKAPEKKHQFLVDAEIADVHLYSSCKATVGRLASGFSQASCMLA